MTAEKFRVLYLFEVSCESSPRLLNSLDTFMNETVAHMLPLLKDSDEKMNVLIGRVICKEVVGIKIHKCLKGVQFKKLKIS